jgi:phosphatidylserine decarboxylase
MSETHAEIARCQPQPLPENIASTQPGGGKCYRLELAWGRWRRWWLKTFRPRYVARMALLRKGEPGDVPHELLDPRDLKYCCNRTTCHWEPADDPFRWRRRIPLAFWGAAEMHLMGWPLLALTLLVAWRLPYVAPLPAVALGLLLFFFRDPPRRVPQEPGLVMSPADGTVAEITKLEHSEFIDGPAVRIGIFLSIFNVHLNRAPVASRVIALRYSPGEFLNALNPESALRNENMWIALEETEPPYRRSIVRQISGLIARRIVCDLRPGQELARGEKFGMIKLGSRTELILPDRDGLEIAICLGQRVRAGKTIMARFARAGEGSHG